MSSREARERRAIGRRRGTIGKACRCLIVAVGLLAPGGCGVLAREYFSEQAPDSRATTELAGTTLEGLRAAIREAIRDEPSLFAPPKFRETPTELVYSFGGVNRSFLEGTDGAPSPLESAAQTLASVEMMRRSIAKGANSAKYWEPILAAAEATVARELALIARPGDDPAAFRRQLQDLEARASQVLIDGISKVAATRSRRAVPAPPTDAFPPPSRQVATKRVVTETVQVPKQETRYRTVYELRQVQVPVTRIEQVPVTQSRPRYQFSWERGMNVPTQEMYTVMVPQSVTRYETVTQNVPRAVPETTTVMQTETRTREVTELKSIPLGRYKVAVVTRPDGANVYYLPRFAYYVFHGQKLLADDADSWRDSWKAFPAKEMVLGQSTYYFRARWEDSKTNHSQIDVDGDRDLILTPND